MLASETGNYFGWILDFPWVVLLWISVWNCVFESAVIIFL